MMINGLYDVPQGDDRTDAAMASMIVRLRRVAKPETMPAGAGTDDALALKLAAAIAEVSSALGDRATTPILQWDAKLDQVACQIAYQAWMDERGRARDANDLIDAAASRAREYLARLRSGDGKSEVPRFVDSAANVVIDAPRFASSRTADAWIERTRCS